MSQIASKLLLILIFALCVCHFIVIGANFKTSSVSAIDKAKICAMPYFKNIQIVDESPNIQGEFLSCSHSERFLSENNHSGELVFSGAAVDSGEPDQKSSEYRHRKGIDKFFNFLNFLKPQPFSLFKLTAVPSSS